MIELRGGVLLAGPRLSAVDRDVAAAIVAVDHAQGIGWVDPQVVVVAVRSLDGAESLAAIGRPEHAGIEHVDGVFGLGVGIHTAVVEGALANVALVVDQLPVGAAVIGDVQAALFVFDHGVDPIGIAAGDRHADLADDTRGQSGIARDLGPIVAPVGRFEEPAARSAASEAPGSAIDVPYGGEEDAGIVGVDDEVDGSRVVVAVEDFVPGGAAILGAEHAAVGIPAVGMAEGGDVDDIGIGGMDADARDSLRVGEANVLPGAAGVGGFIDAIALHDVAAKLGLPHADVDGIGAGSRDRDSPDGRTVELAIGDRAPGGAAVGGLPKAAPRGAEVVFVGARGAAGGGDGSASAGRSDAAPLERAEDGGFIGSGGG
jgi:hypothetical protein